MKVFPWVLSFREKEEMEGDSEKYFSPSALSPFLPLKVSNIKEEVWKLFRLGVLI